MLTYLARQAVAWYPLAVLVLVGAAIYSAVSGRWTWVALVVIVAVLSWFQILFLTWWIRAGEDNDIREGLRENPEVEPGEDGPEAT